MSDEVLQTDDGVQSAGTFQSRNSDVCVSGGTPLFGIPSVVDAGRLFSPSFTHMVEEDLPLIPHSSESVTFGGQWFWELYQHSVLGEHVAVFLGGTGVDLVEDSLQAQKAVRSQAVQQERKGSRFSSLWTSRTAKVEVLYALALSVALRVVREPMLEDNQGPQAVVLCATKDQCDEATFVLNRFCTELHLVVHNLFEPYPAMPAGKLAEIVVGTPPLWESVRALPPNVPPPKTSVEDILVHLFPKSVSPTYSGARSRPYSPQRVVELAMIDVDGQHRLGFSTLLETAFHCVPPMCRVTKIYGTCLSDATETDMLFGREKRLAQKRSTVLVYAPASNISRKRGRAADDDHAEDSEGRGCGCAQASCGLLLRRALSACRLLLDHATYLELRSGVEAEALRFWEGFEGKPVSPSVFAEFVELRLLLVCRRASDHEQHPAYLREVCLCALPTPKAADTCPSRVALLLSHLEDFLSGSLFDGSVVTCTNLSTNAATSAVRPLVFATDETSVHSSVTSLCEYLHETHGISARVAVESPREAMSDESAHSASHRADVAALLSNSAASFIANPRLTVPFPPGFFLPNARATGTFTTVVVRRLGSSKDALCAPVSVDDVKSVVLMLVEECCQYGRVLSYYCHESDAPAEAAPASLFVEFESEASAVETVRLLSARFGQPQTAAGPVVRLFRNTTYYEGVWQREDRGDADSPTDDPFDDLVQMDLLCE